MGGTKCLRLGTCELEYMGGVLQKNSCITRSLGLCAHFAGCAVNLPPRIKNVRTFVKTDGRLAGRLAERKSAHKWTMPLGEVASAGNVRTNQENGLRREGNVRTFRGAWVRRCVGASVRRAPPAEPA